MTPRDFCYWLQGYLEISAKASHDSRIPLTLNGMALECIANHLNMVFAHAIDPTFGDKAHQDKLSEIHQGGATGISGKPEVLARC